MKSMKRINAIADISDVECLEFIALREGISLSDVIRRSIRHYIECVEEQSLPELMHECNKALNANTNFLKEIERIVFELKRDRHKKTAGK